jgi:DNA repair protein RadC
MITLKTLDHTPRLAELKITYKRRRDTRHGDGARRDVLRMPVHAQEYLRSVWDEGTLDLREEFVMLCLDASLAVLGWVRLHAGGLDCSTIDPRLVFGVALQTASAAILVAHNHPSGNLEPSEQDVAVTRRLAEGAKLLGLRFVDHVIVGRSGCFSFAESGMLA